MATVLSILATTFWYMPSVIYRRVFDKSIFDYLKKVGLFTLPFIISYVVIYFILSLISETSIWYFVLKSVITLVVFSIISILCLRKTVEYKEIKEKVFGRKKQVLL